MRTVFIVNAPLVHFYTVRFFPRLPVLAIFAQDAREARASEPVLDRRRHIALDGRASSTPAMCARELRKATPSS